MLQTSYLLKTDESKSKAAVRFVAQFFVGVGASALVSKLQEAEISAAGSIKQISLADQMFGPNQVSKTSVFKVGTIDAAASAIAAGVSYGIDAWDGNSGTGEIVSTVFFALMYFSMFFIFHSFALARDTKSLVIIALTWGMIAASLDAWFRQWY